MANQKKHLRIIKSDNTYELTTYRGQSVWVGKCIHCNKKSYIKEDGSFISKLTIEHIIPKYHGGTDDLENIAIACASCNSHKGRTLDFKKRGHPELEKMIKSLQEKRKARWIKNT
jgi:5-methylcytosine-specific restriction endonuclease McrA